MEKSDLEEIHILAKKLDFIPPPPTSQI